MNVEPRKIIDTLSCSMQIFLIDRGILAAPSNQVQPQQLRQRQNQHPQGDENEPYVNLTQLYGRGFDWALVVLS